MQDFISPVSALGKSSTLQLSDAEWSVGTLGVSPVDDKSFSQFLMRASSGLETQMRTAEATAIHGLEGKATAFEVASAVNEAEQSLRMAIAVRDKVVSAYLEISRMQI